MNKIVREIGEMKINPTSLINCATQRIHINNQIDGSKSVAVYQNNDLIFFSLSDLKNIVSWLEESDSDSNSNSTTSAQAQVNDHVCPTCMNDRVSKSEKNCWKCGSKL